MDKLCCCCEPDIPNISVQLINTPCCESHIEEREAQVEPDLNMSIEEEEGREQKEEDETCCCCFRIKRHAKSKRKKRCRSQDGAKT